MTWYKIHTSPLDPTPHSSPTLMQPSPTTTRQRQTIYFTWLVFMHASWVPFDASNQYKLEQTLSLGGTFVDVQDSHFPGVKRVRVFPKFNYLSYLGVKYRLSRVMQPDAWFEPLECKDVLLAHFFSDHRLCQYQQSQDEDDAHDTPLFLLQPREKSLFCLPNYPRTESYALTSACPVP